ncbi:MAG: bifunctional UDP-N-acetylglucosamine diphosphorylase/glucosamine-1-phosphate N-acetyltransferase GlmU [Anaerolineales bacterium]|nr:bifunctional UDP-N-acetylglucosamine diphosphorylase/glucosamine-1-phosphate N-acetyltransferase GlmU [Anaerolineales bacterium]
MNIESVVLAAGQGTRMRSELPKVLHPLGGRPMLAWSLEACHAASGVWPVVVVAPESGPVRQVAGEGCRYVVQTDRLGTGHAVLQTAEMLRGRCDLVLVASADMPLIAAETMRRVIEAQRNSRAPFAFLTHHGAAARGFGRVMRDQAGHPRAVVEEPEWTGPATGPMEFNSGLYAFEAAWLWEHLPALPPSASGEYYLTDLVAAAYAEKARPETVSPDDPDEVIGINTRVHLAEAERALQRRINQGWMLEGVTITDPATTYIGHEVRLGRDTVVWPNTHLQGSTTIGTNCQIGPNSILREAQVGDRCRVEASVVEGSVLEDDVQIGPFARLRPGAHLMRGVHLGNFGEVKNSTLGPGVKMGHFSYVGDASIGQGANIGAGTITCNFGRDGKKNLTEIGAGAFIGSDTLLVAPVRIGQGSVTGAGSVVTRDVADHSLAVGAPARTIRKLGPDD